MEYTHLSLPVEVLENQQPENYQAIDTLICHYEGNQHTPHRTFITLIDPKKGPYIEEAVILKQLPGIRGNRMPNISYTKHYLTDPRTGFVNKYAIMLKQDLEQGSGRGYKYQQIDLENYLECHDMLNEIRGKPHSRRNEESLRRHIHDVKALFSFFKVHKIESRGTKMWKELSLFEDSLMYFLHELVKRPEYNTIISLNLPPLR